MFFQVKVPTETFAAGRTGEGFLVVVSVHVEGQVIDLVESFVADATFELLFPAVSQLVVLVVTWK